MHSAYLGGPLCLPTGSHLGQSGGEVAGLPVQQNYPDCTRVAQHALVLRPSSHVQSDPIVPAQPVNSVVQPDLIQELSNMNLHAWILDPQLSGSMGSLRQWQHELRLLKEEQPDESMRQSGPFLPSGATVTRWTSGQPPLNAIVDFLLYLFHDRKLQPDTIDGYISAIADKLGNSPINVSKVENLTRLLDSFHRDRRKCQRGIPSWNLSLVLHQLTKAPFEEVKEASLKHFTLKTTFLLTLGSAQHRNEIHAWLH